MKALTGEMQEAFTRVDRELSTLDFPTGAVTKGQPAQSTVAEYRTAMGDYVAKSAKLFTLAESCIEAHGTAKACLNFAADEIGSVPLLEAYERARLADTQLRSESSQPK